MVETFIANSPDQQRAGRKEKKNSLSADIRNPLNSIFLIFTVLTFSCEESVAFRDRRTYVYHIHAHMFTYIRGRVYVVFGIVLVVRMIPAYVTPHKFLPEFVLI